ncbi:cordon-bleu protein-like 1 [Dunckerocampus dactyliophorus]|uniref:cordon-bleu protein-like 1 n=1 Tax=Dunckerocampus dactyliophorus TaxID=161453 RepID=UPI002405CE0D|nr:cordon-bleu protein-like 1 [Dunckerocampus dactyliophorus]
MEDKTTRPDMPEMTVRLLINYNKSHKTVVRVNPQVPLEMLLPVLCDKCELRVETTVLLRDDQSKEPLDIAKTLNEHGLREVYARGTADPLVDQYQSDTPEAAYLAPVQHLEGTPVKTTKPKEMTGFLSLFQRLKKKDDMEGTERLPTSPGLHQQKSAGVTEQNLSYPNTPRKDISKKRRAPPPPMGVSQSVPDNLDDLRGLQRPAASNLRKPKRKAPPPPIVNTQKNLQVNTPDEESVFPERVD